MASQNLYANVPAMKASGRKIANPSVLSNKNVNWFCVNVEACESLCLIVKPSDSTIPILLQSPTIHLPDALNQFTG